MGTTEPTAAVRTEMLTILRDARLALQFAGADANHINMGTGKTALYLSIAGDLTKVIDTLEHGGEAGAGDSD